MKTASYDFIILGGGLIGKSLALALKNVGSQFALIDKNDKHDKQDKNKHNDKKDKNLSNDRALALSYSTTQFLKTLEIPLKSETEILEVQISSQGQFGLTRMQAREFSVPALGKVVAADDLDQTLDERLTETSVPFFRPAEMTAILRQENHWEVHLSTGLCIHTPLIVSAEGSHSRLAEFLNIEIARQDYQQTALVFNVSLSQNHHNVAYERFTKSGTIALLPFGEKQMKCVWIVPKTEAIPLLAFSRPEFLQALQKCFGYRLGAFVQCSPVNSFPLLSVNTQYLYGAGWVMIGNAANTLHPVAAQGYNLGVRDVASLAEILAAVHNQGRVCELEDLQLYERLRKPDQRQSQFFTQTLARLKPSQQMLGILGCEFLPLIKKNIGKQGLGQNARLPRLCRGISL